MKTQAWRGSGRPPKSDTELYKASEEAEEHSSQREQRVHGTEA